MAAKPIESGSIAKVFSFRLGESQEQALEAILADDPSATRGGIIREALNDYLARHRADTTGAA